LCPKRSTNTASNRIDHFYFDHCRHEVLRFGGSTWSVEDYTSRELFSAAEARCDAAFERAAALEDGGADAEEVNAAEDLAGSMSSAVDELMRHILMEETGDIVLLGRMCYRALWNSALTGEDAPDQLKAGPANDFGERGDICDQALGALLGAIRRLALREGGGGVQQAET
jgi:hypothetical protein